MSSRSISFVQLPLLTKPHPSEAERAYYAAYWAAMGRLFGLEFPQGEAYTIPELPLWVTRLSAVARRAGWEAQFVDLAGYTGPEESIPMETLVEATLQAGPGVLCLSPFTANYELAVALAREVKARRPQVLLLVGGAHATELPEPSLQDGFDYVVTGRGEAPLHHLLDGLRQRSPVEPFPGLFSRDGSVPAGIAEDRDLFAPYWELEADYGIIASDYAMHYARIYANLGCPYRCSFCADTMWIGMRPYRRDLSKLRRELLALKERFAPRVLFVGDEVFTVDPAYCRDVVYLLGDAGIPWFCQTRANLLLRKGDHALLDLMAQAGCRLVNIGAESTDAAVLQALRKHITKDQLVAACESVKETGLGVLTYWMVGAPDETRASALATLATITDLFARNLTDLADYFICTPYPGTLIYRDPDRYNVSIAQRPWRFWREDIPSVMRTASLSSDEIYSIWELGLERITVAMQDQST